MKVICIKDDHYFNIRKGKIYDVIASNSKYYRILNNKGTLQDYFVVDFLPIEEYRDQKLNELI